MRVLVGDAAGVDDGAQQPFADVIAGVVVLPGKILFADVAEDIVARRHLIAGQGEGVFGVQDGKAGHDLGVGEGVAEFLVGVGVGDDRAGVHLGPGAHHGQHAPHGESLAVGFLAADIIFLPGILLTINRDRHRFRIITYRTAAHSEQKVRIVISCDLHAFIEFLKCRIRHDAGDLRHIFPVFLKDPDRLVIDPILLDRTAAVDQHHIGAVFGQLRVQIVQRLIAKVEFGRVAV